MCRSREIATRGKLSCFPITRVTMGLICCNTIKEVKEDLIINKSSNGTKPIIYRDSTINSTKLNLQIIKEEEEIMIIIKTFLQCQ